MRGLYLFMERRSGANSSFSTLHSDPLPREIVSFSLSPLFSTEFMDRNCYIFFFSFILFPLFSFSVLLLKDEDIRWKLSVNCEHRWFDPLDIDTKFEKVFIRNETCPYYGQWQIVFYRNHCFSLFRNFLLNRKIVLNDGF